MLMLAVLAMAVAAPAPPPCRLYRAGDDLAAAPAIARAIDTGWPSSWNSRQALARQAIGDSDLAGPLATLACVASWPDQLDLAVRTALPLFTSRVHGNAAMAALDRLARASTATPAERAAASRLRAELVYATDRDRGALE